ncbi:MAG: site-2 protease family protein [Gemmatimonadales bacterium]
MIPLGGMLSVWRTMVVRDREIVDGLVAPEFRGPSPELRRALEEWPGSHYWADGDGESRIVLIRSLSPPRRERWWLHIGLFSISFLTVWMGGALLSGVHVVLPIPILRDFPFASRALIDWVAQLRAGAGLDFAIALMAILLAHEMGHYILARRYSINVSPPYFLPAPPWMNFIGTFGAFIRLRSPVVDRQQLMDVGAAGPWAGFLVALIAMMIGLANSELLPGGAGDQIVIFGQLQIHLGDSLITHAARRLMVGDGTVLLHPLAQAGWFGVLVTMLNLLPLGQLDGGHVLYALVGSRQRLFGLFVWVSLLVLGAQFPGWWLWAAFTLLLGGGRIGHPTVLDRHRPLPRRRRPIGWATVVLFVVTFTPVPLSW